MAGLLAFDGQAWATFPAGNPINATIPTTSWSVELEDVLTIPDSNGQAPRLELLTSGGAPGLAYVIDQRGEIYSFTASDPNPTATPLLDLSTEAPFFIDGFQRGVRGLAFHPDFNNPGTDGFRKFYTAHSRESFSGTPSGNPTIFWSPTSPDHDSIVAEWTTNADGTVNTASYRELIYVGQPQSDHNIGQIGFNPTAVAGDADYGKLYIALGDGGGVQDPSNLAQNIGIDPPSNPTGYPHGSILRIDPIAADGQPYTIPTDNPFFGQSGIIEEVWAYGLRNPHRFAWDPVTGKMLIAEIGQANVEEINLGAPGANFGWDPREGTFQTTGSSTIVDSLPASHPTDPFTYPVAQYDHDPDNDNTIEGSWAVVGGSVYRGPTVPQLAGMYLFGDFGTNTGPVFAVHVGDLVQRDDFSNLANLDDGLLAPVMELSLTQGGQAKTLLQIVRDASGNQSLSRTDLRFGVGPDDEIYILNKHDGVVRRIASVSGLVAGDLNRDGVVDEADLPHFLEVLLNGPFDVQADMNEDGIVNGLDVDGFVAAVRGPGTQAVPEPSTFVLAGLALLALARNHSRAVRGLVHFSAGSRSLGN